MCLYEIKGYLKKEIRNMVMYIILQFDIYNGGQFSNKSIGQLIRSLHFGLPIIITYLFMIVNTKNMYHNIVYIMICIAMFFYINDGCIITMVEQKYNEDNFTIIDPFLELFYIPLTNINRYVISLIMACMYIIFILVTYRIRFMYNDNKNK